MPGKQPEKTSDKINVMIALESKKRITKLVWFPIQVTRYIVELKYLSIFIKYFYRRFEIKNYVIGMFIDKQYLKSYENTICGKGDGE